MLIISAILMNSYQSFFASTGESEALGYQTGHLSSTDHHSRAFPGQECHAGGAGLWQAGVLFSPAVHICRHTQDRT